MTHDNMSNILASIGEAKRALDAEPDYLNRIRNLEDAYEDQRETVAKRELHILGLKQANEELMQKLRSVEAERDDAGFRALEEADKVQGLLTLVRGFVTDGLKLIAVADGKGEQIVIGKDILNGLEAEVREWKDEVIGLELELADRDRDIYNLKTDISMAQEQLHRPFAAAMAQGTEGGSGSGGISSSATPHSDRWDADARAFVNAAPSAIGPAEDQRVADPTAPSIDTGNSVPTQVVGTQENALDISGSGQSDGPFAPTETMQLQPASLTGAETIDVVASNALGPDTWRGSGNTEWSFASSEGLFEPQSVDGPKPAPERNRDESTRFTGRKYFDVTYFVPLHEWLNKGGAREDYYWRPAEANTPLPEPSRASQQSS